MDNVADLRAQDLELNEDSSEKKLLRAILFRSLADLSPHLPRGIRRDAILWFEDTDIATDGIGYSFQYICDILEFSTTRIGRILERVAAAKSTLNTRIPTTGRYTFKARMYYEQGTKYVC